MNVLTPGALTYIFYDVKITILGIIFFTTWQTFFPSDFLIWGKYQNLDSSQVFFLKSCAHISFLPLLPAGPQPQVLLISHSSLLQENSQEASKCEAVYTYSTMDQNVLFTSYEK